MRRPFVSVLIAMMLVSACSGSSGPAPRSSLAGSQSSFSLTPNEVNLTPGMPSDTVYAQGATVGVSYTPYAPAACMRSIGSIVVVGEGVAHVDVAGSPLQFVVAAVGATPPHRASLLWRARTGPEPWSKSPTATIRSPACAQSREALTTTC